MTRLDLVGTLQTYALRVSKCSRKERIIEIIKELKQELNISKLRKDLEEKENDNK